MILTKPKIMMPATQQNRNAAAHTSTISFGVVGGSGFFRTLRRLNLIMITSFLSYCYGLFMPMIQGLRIVTGISSGNYMDRGAIIFGGLFFISRRL